MLNNSKIIKYLILSLIIILAMIGRYYYSFVAYNFTFSSGDATGYILRALNFQEVFFKDGYRINVGEVSNSLFETPFLIPYTLAVFGNFLHIDLYKISFLITSLVTTLSVLFLFKFITIKNSLWIAALTTLAIAINSYMTFFSTEPLKAPYIVSFYIISLYYLFRGGDKNIHISIFFLSCTILFHLTGIFFIFSYAIIYIIYNRKYRNKYLDLKFILWIVYIFLCMYMIKTLAHTYHFNANSSLGLNTQLTFAQSEIQAFFSNIQSGGENFGLSRFIEGIKSHIGDYFFYLGIVGSVISIFMKKYRSPILSFSLLIVFIGFSSKWVAYSHGSRYPFYVDWFFIYFAILFLGIVIDRIKGTSMKIIISFLLLVLILISETFLVKYVAGFRHQYKANREMGIYIGKNIEVNSFNKILLMGWPSTIFEILNEKGVDTREDIITYGWKTIENLDEMDLNFLINNNIEYFVYEKTGSDYNKSYDLLQEQLSQYIHEVHTIKDGKSRIAILYKVIY